LAYLGIGRSKNKVIKILFICHGNICPSFEEPHEHGLCGESEKKNTTVLLPIYNMWYFKKY